MFERECPRRLEVRRGHRLGWGNGGTQTDRTVWGGMTILCQKCLAGRRSWRYCLLCNCNAKPPLARRPSDCRHHRQKDRLGSDALIGTCSLFRMRRGKRVLRCEAWAQSGTAVLPVAVAANQDCGRLGLQPQRRSAIIPASLGSRDRRYLSRQTIIGSGGTQRSAFGRKRCCGLALDDAASRSRHGRTERAIHRAIVEDGGSSIGGRRIMKIADRSKA